MKTTTCKNCGGVVVDGKQKWHHLKKCMNLKEEGVDHLVCAECGYRARSLGRHIKLHGMTSASYREKFPGAPLILPSMVEAAANKMRGREVKPVSEKRGAKCCDVCGEWYQPESAVEHRQKCVSEHPDAYEESRDYVVCPVCGEYRLRLGNHLRRKHGWAEDRVQLSKKSGMQMMAKSVSDERRKTIRDRYGSENYWDVPEIAEKRRATFRKKYGVDNPFADSGVQEKIKETNRRRYGVDHPMQNEEVFARQQESANQSPNSLERFFDEHTCDNVVFTGYGGRYIRTKTGVHKFGRLIKDLCPDFLVLPDNVLKSAKSASSAKRKFNNERHRTRWVIELLGDYYHSEEVIGVEASEHVEELVAAYASAGIECLVLWEVDVLHRWSQIRPMVEAWIERAVADINEKPIWKRRTRAKVDRRKAQLVCPFGSGKTFRSQAKLDLWVNDSKNYWRPGLVEGRDYVACLECGERLARLGRHLKSMHGLTATEYIERNEGAVMICEAESSRITARQAGRKRS